jgi:hypothetical protein
LFTYISPLEILWFRIEVGAGGWSEARVELLLNGFEDDVQNDAGSADQGRGFADATVETCGGIAEGGFHLFEGRSVALGHWGKVGEMPIAFDEEIDEPAVVGGIEHLVVGKKGIRDLVNNAIHGEGKTGERSKFHVIYSMLNFRQE